MKLAGVCAILAAAGLFASPSLADVTIRASIQSPQKSLLSKGYDWLLDEIEKETQGRVKFERYYSGSLAKPADQLRATSTSLAGMALVVPSYVPAQLPLANVGSNPALWVDSWAGSKAYAELYKKEPAMVAELDKQNVKLISAIATPTYYLLARKVDLNNFSQLNGMRIMASGEIAVMLKSVGAQIVSVPTPEGYEAMERGTVDGAVYGLTSAVTYGVQNTAQSLWLLPVGGLPMIIVMNKNVWNSISKEDQAAITKVAEGHAKAFHEIYQIGGDDESMKAFEKAKVKVNKASPEALAKLREAAEKKWNAWAEQQQSQNRPGKQVLATFEKLSAEYAKQNPYKK